MKRRLPIPTLGGPIDWWLYVTPVLLVGFSIAMIASVTYATNRSGLAITQAINAGIGLVAMIILTRFDYRNWRGLAWAAYAGVVLLLLAVEQFGTVIFGARRWLAIGGFQLQPSELMKLVLALALARFFADREQFNLKDYGWLALGIGLPVLLVMQQPDLGTAIILGTIAFGICVAGGIPKKIMGGLVLLGILLLPIAWQLIADYQRQRVLTFLNPASDPYGAGYNVLQALIAVGSGGLTGQGLGRGSQSQQQFLPVAHTDFIFAGVAEAVGFLGAFVLICLLFFLLLRVIRVARYSRDRFGYLVAVGVGISLLAQIGINIGMNLGLAPVTGIPLPFVSHGGTALITNLAAIGILQSIMLRHKKITFSS